MRLKIEKRNKKQETRVLVSLGEVKYVIEDRNLSRQKLVQQIQMEERMLKHFGVNNVCPDFSILHKIKMGHV